MALFTVVQGRDGLRHVIPAGAGVGFPHPLCGRTAIVLRDDPTLPECNDCRVRALGEVAVALDVLSFPTLSEVVERLRSGMLPAVQG